ncbi:MAG TPA: hypothetical protein VFV14_06765 [Myxococcaceae bacterium]|nr:hypothetical protein [Myxococcaceae bacterium]
MLPSIRGIPSIQTIQPILSTRVVPTALVNRQDTPTIQPSLNTRIGLTALLNRVRLMHNLQDPQDQR